MTVTVLSRKTSEESTESDVRWMPSRAGILNVWRYYDEVFEFHRGRLLLRGPNGSGKSKALELLLPFLFDANLKANRLSTFGTAERTMHWNLMGEGASGTTRVGYVWLEFRLAEYRWFTCGARLQASSHTSAVHPDYFTTDQRIGMPDGLYLTIEGRPLTRGALEQGIGEHGDVYSTASEYREAVRTTLFPELNEQRYDAFITALLQLRTPKLSQRLDPSLLSSLLSRALPPLGQSEIADLAEGFERLDAQRERLRRLEEEVEATRVLARRQRTYAQRVLRAGAASLISATTELDRLSAAAKQSAEQYTDVEHRKGEIVERIQTLDNEHEEVDARKDGLMETDAYKQGQQLDNLRQEVERARIRADRARRDATSQREHADGDAERHRRAEETLRGYEIRVAALAEEARQAAARVALSGVYEEIASAAESDRPRGLLRAAVRSKRQQIAAVDQALRAHEQAIALRQRAEQDLDRAREESSRAGSRHEKAVADRADAAEALRDRLRAWAGGCHELSFTDLDALLESAESESALAEQIRYASQVVLSDIAQQRERVEAETTAVGAERGRLIAERDGLAAEHDIPPAAPHWRTADRTRMAGAPLWRVVDFADNTTESVRASVEAALEASGLLDAWLGARGEIVGHDVFADPDAVAPVSGRSLAEVLTVVPDAEVDSAVVARLLAGIAFGDNLPEAVAAIAADGSWRLGNLTGSAHKDEASYIGALTRQRARERRIRELNEQIAGHDSRLAELESLRARLDIREQTVEAELASRPGSDELIAAQRVLDRAEADLEAIDTLVRQRIAAVTEQEGRVRAALIELSGVAADAGLPADAGALDRVREGLDHFSEHTEKWLDTDGERRSAAAVAEERAEKSARSAELAVQFEQDAEIAESNHRALAAKADEIDRTVGLDYRGVLDKLQQFRERLRELNRQLTAARREQNDLANQLGGLAAKQETDIQARDAASTTRDALAQRFRRLTIGDFPTDSEIPELDKFRQTLADSEGVRAALDAARLVAAAWPTIPCAPNNVTDALGRLADSVHESRTALSSRADLELETDEDVQVFTAIIDGVRVGAAELLATLRREADQSRNEITERERHLFDQTLTGDTRRHLAARIRQANDLVDGMNARLEKVRTASNVSVKLVWQIAPDLPPGTKAARDLLLRDPIRLTEADHEALHRFLRDRIEEAKADDTATSWEQQLAQVFDYTKWHQFVVKIDRGNGQGYQLLTKKLHGALSGGEKAIALHLPLFAAVAAHYQASPQAPRVILLDEVFVGVDSTNRGQIFALLSALDLDLVLTSDHEWCTYAELDGIAIHQILAGDGDDAVTTARFTWDGVELLAESGATI
ncbi:TIGR02680 family protein [Nocardia sp. BMG51109]|uniref:TIGR02680 family protein n=1 Tax=Nocardia sp. BMG51109 TaxID=1056816 RepID=UPI000466ED45|nr:TIGR02680 family protein [Nocardia sp. BMG51109]